MIDKKEKKLSMIFVIVVVVILLGALLYYSFFRDSKEVGEEAPNFVLTDTQGNEIELKDYRGQVVILDFMATWCGPCKEELEHLKSLYTDYKDDIEIISIDIDDSESAEQVRSLKEGYNASWTFAPNGDHVSKKYDVRVIPKIYMIDQQGKIAFKETGKVPESVLESEVNKLL